MMKKIAYFVAVLVLCLSMVTPAFAAAGEFAPSVSYKDNPDIVEVTKPDGGKAMGVVKNASGAVVQYLEMDCLVITSVADAASSTEIPDAAEALLLQVYAALNDGSMKLPYEKVGMENRNMVIRDLFDASWLCVTTQDKTACEEVVAPAGVHVELVFDLGVAAGVEVVAMTYKNNQWNPIVDVVNNGDGTVTCVFEDFCPIAFAVPASDGSGSTVPTGDTAGSYMVLWVVLMVVCAAAVVTMILRRKNAR